MDGIKVDAIGPRQDIMDDESVIRPDEEAVAVGAYPPPQGLLVFRNSDQFERLMHLDGVVSECGGDILPTVQSQQIQDGIANAG